MGREREKLPCPKCRGKGSYYGEVRWSDGLGGVDMICTLCDGNKVIGAPPLELADRYKAERNIAAAELARLKRCVGLYLHTIEGKLPDPPYREAPRPGSYPRHWREELDKAIRDIPRLPRKEAAA